MLTSKEYPYCWVIDWPHDSQWTSKIVHIMQAHRRKAQVKARQAHQGQNRDSDFEGKPRWHRKLCQPKDHIDTERGLAGSAKSSKHT